MPFKFKLILIFIATALMTEPLYAVRSHEEGLQMMKNDIKNANNLAGLCANRINNIFITSQNIGLRTFIGRMQNICINGYLRKLEETRLNCSSYCVNKMGKKCNLLCNK